ncbi:MAG: transposase [Balneolaceae bacterium]|nr:transposase [Balneolaceae bacterium]
MGRSSYRVYDSDYPYFITSLIVEGYPIFAQPLAAEIVLNALCFLQKKRDTKLYAYVIMENHIHLVLQADRLSSKIQAFKSWTARAIIDAFKETGRYHQLRKLRKAKNPSHIDSVHQLWQEGFHPKHIFSNAMMIQKIEYIHQNPVKRGFVDREEDWTYSSARNYLGMRGLIPVTLFEL